MLLADVNNVVSPLTVKSPSIFRLSPIVTSDILWPIVTGTPFVTVPILIVFPSIVRLPVVSISIPPVPESILIPPAVSLELIVIASELPLVDWILTEEPFALISIPPDASISIPPDASISSVLASISIGLSWFVPIAIEVSESSVNAPEASISNVFPVPPTVIPNLVLSTSMVLICFGNMGSKILQSITN